MDLSLIAERYRPFRACVLEGRRLFGRPLTLGEKILYAHFAADSSRTAPPTRGVSVVRLLPDRVAMQDATAQMAMLQFMSVGRKRVAVPSSIHCDHLIRAGVNAVTDLNRALEEHKEVYDFLASAAGRYGIDYWKPGSGIIHQIVLENYAFPGGLIIVTDSHTPNAGGLGMIAVGVGGADAAEVMAGLPWSITWPKFIGVKLTGALNGWTAPKDVILKLAGILTVSGGTGKIIEYFGPGVASLSCTGRATITNMGAEIGATTSIFPADERLVAYLEATGRKALADLCTEHLAEFQADREVEQAPEKYFDELVEIDLSLLEPHVVGPHTPDLARSISEFAEEVKSNKYPDRVRAALIGSCTNSSYEDLSRCAAIARQALDHGVKAKVALLITPGSDSIYATIDRDELIQTFTQAGATVLANACGPCIGQWKRDDIKRGEPNTIVTSFNRNFRGRNDGNPETLAFIASPEIVTAFAFSGALSFNPLTDTLQDSEGEDFRLAAPRINDLPRAGFVVATEGRLPPAVDPAKVPIAIDPASERLALLEPFNPWHGKDFVELPLLLKAIGKCTTDHISPAGPWLKYRGHLDRISDNMFSGAVNSFSGETGRGLNVINNTRNSFSAVARDYKKGRLNWVVIGDENYGEGSSREHAAMSPRYLGCVAVIARSFARIAETNLKKQGVLALTFIDPEEYEDLDERDRISITGLGSFSPGAPLDLTIHKTNGESVALQVKHSFTWEQIGWFKAGSALNSSRQVQHGE